MAERPEFIDNRDGNTLKTAINYYLQQLDGKLAGKPDLDVVTGYFNPNGYFSIADGLDHVGNIRLLIGAQPEKEDREHWHQPGDPSGEEYNKQRIEEVLQSLDRDLRRDRDLLGFSKNIDKNLQQLVDFLRSDRVDVRRHEDKFIHGKAYLFSESEGVIAGSSNLTGAGLNSNLELNLGHYNPGVTRQVQTWVEELWEDSEPYDLAKLYEERFEPYSPYLIYLRVLYERYGDEIEQEKKEDSGEINLANFQEDGRRRARRFLDEHDGVIVADEVGLGKTYIGGKLLEETVQQRRQRALVVAPAYLRDGMWKRVRQEWNFYFDVVSYAELRNDRRLGGDEDYLGRPVEDYQMVILDEAHAFRNPRTQQSQALRQLLRGSPPKDVVMLTATPVNNSLWDLYYLLRYFIKNDAAFVDQGIRSFRDRFKTAQSENPSDLSPEMLFDILDETTVRRTRRFIKNHYDQARLPDGEGGYVRVDFPEQHPRRIDYSFTETFGDAYFQDISDGLAADEENEDPGLSLARYRPARYLEGEEDASELSLVGLLRTGLLKRFESSSKAFATTLERMIAQYEAALELMDEGYFPDPEAIEEWVETDSDEAMEELFEEADSAHQISLAAASGVDKLQRDLEADLTILRRWHNGAAEVTREDDEKLSALQDSLKQIVREAREDAEKETLSEEEEEAAFRQNRKVLIFSYYKDTVKWILEHLKEAVSEDDDLSCYEGRIAAVTGDSSFDNVSQNEAVYGFAPNSSDAPEDAEDQFDILIATDVLGQGVNLQDARHVINYDLPWNPMRVVQRNGRIDRINSPHSDIYPTCVFPEDQLDDLLDLEKNVRKKITQAAKTIGEDGGIFPDIDSVEQNFSDKREDIEALEEGDPEAYEQGTREAAAYSGEEYRQELREGLEDHEERIKSLPWAAGSGLRGSNPGYFFCARIGGDLYLRFVPDNQEEVVQDTLTCLQRIECTEETDRVLPDERREQVYDAWETARSDIFQHWQEQTDPLSVEPEIPKILREVGDHLREHWPSDMTQEKLERTRESVQAPLSNRESREFREVYDDESLDPIEKSRRFIDKVEELGLEPFEAPGAKPQIQPDEIKLICWMAVAPEEQEE